MDEKQPSGQKPLRQAYNKTIDLAKTYFKNGDGRTMSNKSEKSKAEEINENEIEVENSNIEAEANGENTFSESEVSEMLNKIEQLTKERDEAKETMLRNAAELENFRRRSMREKEEIVQYANERLLYKFLEIIDTLGSALDAGKKSTDYDSLIKGLELLHCKTVKLFEEAGVTAMPDQVATEFNVDYMDALLVAPSELPEGQVVQVISPGYMYGEKVLRHSKVITSSGTPAPSAE